MRMRFAAIAPVVIAASLCSLDSSVQAQERLALGRRFRPCPCPDHPLPEMVTPWPSDPTTPWPSPTDPTLPMPTPIDAPSFGMESGGAVGSYFTMKGAQLGIPALAFARPFNPNFPPVPGQPPPAAILVPTVRSFKISDNDSPAPLDRVYFNFNYFDNVNAAVNRRFQSDIHNINVYHETFGLEKTFLGGDASIGLRLPLNSLSAESSTPGLTGTDFDLGDLTIITKYAFWRDYETGSLLSTGLAITVPSGPDRFAGTDRVFTMHETILQPFVGYLWNIGDFYVHGFLALDIPTSSRDVTSLDNHHGVGYFLYRNPNPYGFLTAVVPTMELHVSNPLNHQGAFAIDDPAGTPDVVNLTFATTFEIRERATVAVGVAVPVTGPRPFDIEVLVQLNYRFGPMFGVAPGLVGAR